MQSQKQLIVYYHPLSQPSRAIQIFCKMNNIEAEFKIVNLFRGETKTKEFTEMNPLQLIPTIKDGDFSHYESHSIMRYLAKTRPVKEHFLHNNDAQKFAKIDRYLDWHHTYVRRNASTIFFNIVLAEKAGRTPMTSDQLLPYRKGLHLALKMLNNVNLGNNQKYIASDDNVSAADLTCFCELIQLIALDYDFDKYPNVLAWMKNMLLIKEVYEGNASFFEFVNGYAPQAAAKWIKVKPNL